RADLRRPLRHRRSSFHDLCSDSAVGHRPAPLRAPGFPLPSRDTHGSRRTLDLSRHAAVFAATAQRKAEMTAKDFRPIALSLEGAEEGSHFGAVDFRVGGRIFATLAAVKQGYGNLMLTPEQQTEFVAEQPELFLPIPGGWGKSGATHIRLAEANEDVLA